MNPEDTESARKVILFDFIDLLNIQRNVKQKVITYLQSKLIDNKSITGEIKTLEEMEAVRYITLNNNTHNYKFIDGLYKDKSIFQITITKKGKSFYLINSTAFSDALDMIDGLIKKLN